MARISIIDSQSKLAAGAKDSLERGGHAVDTFTDAKDAARSFDTEPPDLVIIVAVGADVPNALGLAPGLRERKATADLPIVLVAQIERSGWDRTFDTEEAFAVDALLDYPCDADVLVRRVNGIIAARESAAPLAKRGVGFDAILDRAIANEEAAAAFYEQAAEAAQQKQTQDILKKLAEEEQTHKRIINEFKSGDRPLPQGEIKGGAVLEAFGAPELSTDLSPTDAFLLAAKKEKAAVELYESWAALYPPGPEQQLLKDLADMERSHKAWVEEMFANASFPEIWG